METSVEDEVYDMRDDSDANNDAFEDSNEKSLKRPSASVIVIDDSDTEDSSVCHVDSYQATASEAKKLRKGAHPQPHPDRWSSLERIVLPHFPLAFYRLCEQRALFVVQQRERMRRGFVRRDSQCGFRAELPLETPFQKTIFVRRHQVERKF